MTTTMHQPVLLNEVLTLLQPSENDHYLDLTAGYGGHATSIISHLGPKGRAVLIDRDENAVTYLRKLFKNDNRVEILHADYLSGSKELQFKKQSFDVVLADIGVSSPHLDNPDRGFSFMNDGPLDMRMDRRSEKTAASIVNTCTEEELANILYLYGELYTSRRVAHKIVQHRPYHTTNELASIIPGGYKDRIRTCAQVFQALRIVVNDELGQLENSLPIWHQLLNKGGRLGVITFHSLEDRIVKQYASEHGADVFGSELSILTKRPIAPSADEVAFNPRARSSKLRVVQRK